MHSKELVEINVIGRSEEGRFEIKTDKFEKYFRFIIVSITVG